MSEVIELRLPIRADLTVLVRYTAATLAARAEFGVDEIDDLRLAADELCLSVTGGESGGEMFLKFVLTDNEIEISCEVDADAVAEREEDDPEAEWSLRILDALVDGHGRETVDGKFRAWLRKSRERSHVDG